MANTRKILIQNKNGDNSIVASNLNKIVKGKKLLNDVSFTIPTGTISIFIGSSGAGKTTTIKSLLNLYTLDSGTINICGFDSKDRTLHYKIGYVPEKENFPKMSA
jgi:ABC-2 type transport system ATP-binding protein